MMQVDQYGVVEAKVGDQNFTIVDILDTLESAQKAAKRLRDRDIGSRDGVVYLVITLKNNHFKVQPRPVERSQTAFKDLG